jgi:hypothetical protein
LELIYLGGKKESRPPRLEAGQKQQEEREGQNAKERQNHQTKQEKETKSCSATVPQVEGGSTDKALDADDVTPT